MARRRAPEPADQKAALWLSKRVFTPYGAAPQDAKWSEPEELKTGSKLEFSTNGESWYFPPTSNDVYLRESPTSPKVIMRGEAGTQNQVKTAGAFVTGLSYTIQAVGSTDFTLIGAASNLAGVVFTATGPGKGSGTAIENVSQITGYAFFGVITRLTTIRLVAVSLRPSRASSKLAKAVRAWSRVSRFIAAIYRPVRPVAGRLPIQRRAVPAGAMRYRKKC